MRKHLVLLFLLVPIVAQAQPTPSTSRPPTAQSQPTPPPLPSRQPAINDRTHIKSELDKVFNGLASQLKEVENLAANLKSTANRKPEDTQQQLSEAANTLSTLADRLVPNGDLAGQLTALRSAAAIHRQRILDMPKEALEEADRTGLLQAWDRIIVDADKGTAAMSTMRERLMAVLGKLRARQVAVSEFLLADQFQSAVNAVKSWINDLDTTINGLRKVIEPVKPSS